MTRPVPAQQGFTLVEMMIALLIFGLLAAAGAALLSFSVRAQGITAAKFDDIGALQRLSSAMAADLAQASNRPGRDETGVVRPAFVGAADGSTTPMLRLARAGWSNFDDAARPTVQRVDYLLENGAIERVAYPMLDGAQPLPPAVLLDHVASVRLRYRLAGAWSDRWEGQPGIPLPEAVEIAATRSDGTALRLVLLVGTGYADPVLGQPGQ